MINLNCGGGYNIMDIKIRPVVIEDYDLIYELWNSTEQSSRALNPVDDSRDGIERYLKRNPTTCFLAYDMKDNKKIIGVILTGHDGRRAIVHHLCVHPDFRRQGVARMLVQRAEEALRKEGITKIFGLVFKDNNVANEFWEGQGYTIRTNLNYRNKSLNDNVPQGE
jgi:ribosomal protein S18 acetylase RimI-like enzyme